MGSGTTDPSSHLEMVVYISWASACPGKLSLWNSKSQFTLCLKLLGVAFKVRVGPFGFLQKLTPLQCIVIKVIATWCNLKACVPLHGQASSFLVHCGLYLDLNLPFLCAGYANLGLRSCLVLRSWEKRIPVTFLFTLSSNAMGVCRNRGGGGAESLRVDRETRI